MAEKIILDKPAKEWGDALLIGNGSLGGAVYGGIKEDRIDLSHIAFFSGSIGNNNQSGASKAFGRMRQCLLEGDYSQSVKEAEGFIGCREDYGTNLPVGQLTVKFSDMDDLKVETYSRQLDLENGIGTTAFAGIQGTTELWHEREYFASVKEHCLSYRIHSSKPMDITIDFANEHMSFKTVSYWDGFGYSLQALESVHSSGSSGVILQGRLQVTDCDGTIVSIDHGLKVSGITRCLFQLRMMTNFDMESENFIKPLSMKALDNDGENVSYEKVKSDHIRWFSDKMNRVTLDLPEDTLSQRMFQYGRYLLLSSSNPLSPLPAHLQGLWNDDVACQIGWTCDMHLDINTQMNYWLSEAGNLSECHEPLFHWMEKALIPSGRITARKSYGFKGWTADLVSNAWGFTAPYWSNTISPCPTGGIWAASHYWEHYCFTLDRDFLVKRVWPVLEEAVQFFCDYVFEIDGQYSTGPSISPENSFIIEENRYYFSLGCTYEVAAVRALFSQYIQLMTILEQESELLARVKEIHPKMLPYRVSTKGTIAEYSHDFPAYDDQHRHMSHLLGLYPYDQITPEKTPELAEAAYKTITDKLSPYEQWEDTGWARSMIILYMARLHKGDEALWHIREMQSLLTRDNLLVMHPPTRGAASFKEVYELDGNTGLSMGIIEMLLQSHDSVLRLLPACPKEWQTGRVKGLKARGNITVDIEWLNGALKEASFLSTVDQKIRISYRDRGRELQLKAGEKATTAL